MRRWEDRQGVNDKPYILPPRDMTSHVILFVSVIPSPVFAILLSITRERSDVIKHTSDLINSFTPYYSSDEIVYRSDSSRTNIEDRRALSRVKATIRFSFLHYRAGFVNSTGRVDALTEERAIARPRGDSSGGKGATQHPRGACGNAA